MRNSPLGLLVVLLFVGAFAASCGSKEDKDKEAAGKPCGAAPAAMSGTPSLPAQFPSPSEVTYTSSKKEGPTTVLGGYFAGDLDAAYDAYKGALSGKSGYNVTHAEHDPDDAEVNFAGHSKSGQVALKESCRDRTSLTITARPD
jgi:hypothetical protein